MVFIKVKEGKREREGLVAPFYGARLSYLFSAHVFSSLGAGILFDLLSARSPELGIFCLFVSMYCTHNILYSL